MNQQLTFNTNKLQHNTSVINMTLNLRKNIFINFIYFNVATTNMYIYLGVIKNICVTI